MHQVIPTFLVLFVIIAISGVAVVATASSVRARDALGDARAKLEELRNNLSQVMLQRDTTELRLRTKIEEIRGWVTNELAEKGTFVSYQTSVLCLVKLLVDKTSQNTKSVRDQIAELMFPGGVPDEVDLNRVVRTVLERTTAPLPGGAEMWRLETEYALEVSRNRILNTKVADLTEQLATAKASGAQGAAAEILELTQKVNQLREANAFLKGSLPTRGPGGKFARRS